MQACVQMCMEFVKKGCKMFSFISVGACVCVHRDIHMCGHRRIHTHTHSRWGNGNCWTMSWWQLLWQMTVSSQRVNPFLFIFVSGVWLLSPTSTPAISFPNLAKTDIWNVTRCARHRQPLRLCLRRCINECGWRRCIFWEGLFFSMSFIVEWNVWIFKRDLLLLVIVVCAS